jgi:triacylglycerol lipase
MPGIAASYFNYASVSTQWVTNPAIGPALARDIACLADSSAAGGGPGRVIVIAHSMGGLALRQAASDTVGREGVASRIGLAVTVATPNLGSWIDGLVGGRSASAGADLGLLRRFVATAGRVCSVASPQSGTGGALQQVCSLVTAPFSPAAQAMVPGSAQLAALPVLPASLPVFAVAGDITLTSGVGPLANVALPVRVGDLLVYPQSALAEANPSGPGGGSYTADCTMAVSQLTDGRAGGWTGCSHGGLLYDPSVISAVERSVTAYLSAHPS